LLFARKILGLAGIAAIASILLILVTEEGVHLAEYVTSVAAGLTLAILGVAYWTFKPEIDKAIRERKQQIPAGTSENSSLLLEKTKSPEPEFGGFFKKGIQYSTGIKLVITFESRIHVKKQNLMMSMATLMERV